MWIGIPILILCFAGVRGWMSLDRVVLRWLLRTPIPRKQADSRASAGNQTIADQLKNLVFSTRSWVGVVYCISKMATGTISFVLAILLLTIPMALAMSPIADALDLDSKSVFDLLRIDFATPNTGTAIECIAGLFLMPICVAGINALAWLNSRWMKLWLSQ